MPPIIKAVGASLLVSQAAAFGGLGMALPAIHDVSTAIAPFVHHQASVAPLSVAGHELANLLEQYKQCLATNPLETKMATGGALAVMGDAIAQSREVDEPYDARRASSFMVFDMCYRALQHVAFPAIVQQCQGQYIGAIASSIPPLAHLISHASVTGADPTSYMAAMEQTLASQLGIVPFMYYPVFFALTGVVQGLSSQQAMDRAKEKFLPLMSRNLLFWIPVQFIQFGFVEEGLQIPFLSICGLAWTFTLSVMAGSTKTYSDKAVPDIEPVIDPDVAIVSKIVKTAARDRRRSLPDQTRSG